VTSGVARSHTISWPTGRTFAGEHLGGGQASPSPGSSVVEQRTRNAQVRGSSPLSGSTSRRVSVASPSGTDYLAATIAIVNGTKTEIAPGVWRLRVYVGRNANGSPVQRSKTLHAPERKPGAGVRLADRELAKMIAEASRGSTAIGTETVGQLLDRFLDHAESLGRSPTTLREHRRTIEKTLRPELGRIKLAKLTAADLDRLYARLTARGLKATSVRRIHAVMGAALRQAERWDLVDHNVAHRATPPPVHAAEIVAPSPDEVQRILVAAEASEPALAAMLLLAALTGARRGELCALRWSDVDYEASMLSIARSVYETAGGGWAEKGTKTHQARRIGLDDLGLAILRRHRGQVDALAAELGATVAPDAFLFSRSPAGLEPIRPDVLTKFTIRVAKAAGVDTHLHALRHFSATQAIAAGFDAVTVSARLGHADPSITLRVYAHAIEGRDRELAASLGRTLALPVTSS
jgi:integrase